MSKLYPLPDYGTHMTLEKFIERCKSGLFIDYDGFGEYATETQVTHLTVRPSDVKKGKLNKTYTHVVWYNR